jgi:sialidase-1
MYTLSKDEGISWSAPVDELTLPEPGFGCMASFIRLSSKKDDDSKNRILFSNPASNKGRENMTIRTSYSEGKSWQNSKLLYEGPSGYSSMTVLPDGSIGMLYETGEKSLLEKIAFARFNLSWLTEGKDNFKRKR